MYKILKKYSHKYGSTYLTGIIMGVNAIKDIALYIDGPDCNFYKADTLYKTHDLNSSLKSPSINTRIYFSGVMPNGMINGYENKILKKLNYISQNKNFQVGIFSFMPVTGLLGVQYDNIYKQTDKQFIFVPSFTDKFRLDGYSILLKEIAKGININNNLNIKKDKLSVSIIGFLYDRNEGDCIGNIEEIKRLLNLLGVEIDSIWLNGGNYNDLKNITKSKLLISLPYGSYAVKILKKRFDIDYIETNIPMGLKSTIKFIKDISIKLNINKQKVDELIEEEVKLIRRKINILDLNRFLNKNYIFAGDPNLEESIIDIGNMLGMNHIKTYPHTGVMWPNKNDIKGINIDIVIGNSEFEISGLNYMKFDFGFPLYTKHYLSNRPFMGFKGILNFIEGLYIDISKIDENIYQEIKNYDKNYYF